MTIQCRWNYIMNEMVSEIKIYRMKCKSIWENVKNTSNTNLKK